MGVTVAGCRELSIALAADNVGALPAVDGQDTEYHDTVQPGLSLLVGVSGYRRYLYQYPFSADSERHNIGKIIDVSLADARTMIGGWAWTLFQTTRGHDGAETLRSRAKDVIVEGITDFWYLSAASTYLRAQNRRTALAPDTVITPAGGASNAASLVGLLSSRRRKVAVLLGTRPDADDPHDRMRSVRVGDALATPPQEADVEDLLDPEVFDRLAHEAYTRELGGRTVAPDTRAPRIVARYEQAFAAIGLEFHNTRVARLFLHSKMSTAPAAVLSPAALDRFERLFVRLNALLAE